MKITMRDKVCQLIGKYEEKEQYFLTSAIAAGFATVIGMERSKSATDAKMKADMCGLFLDDLKNLLDEDRHDDNLDALRYCPCNNEDDYKKGKSHHE